MQEQARESGVVAQFVKDLDGFLDRMLGNAFRGRVPDDQLAAAIESFRSTSPAPTPRACPDDDGERSYPPHRLDRGDCIARGWDERGLLGGVIPVIDYVRREVARFFATTYPIAATAVMPGCCSRYSGLVRQGRIGEIQLDADEDRRQAKGELN